MPGHAGNPFDSEHSQRGNLRPLADRLLCDFKRPSYLFQATGGHNCTLERFFIWSHDCGLYYFSHMSTFCFKEVLDT